MDDKLSRLKRAAASTGSDIAWEVYHQALARCGVKQQIEALNQEEATLRARLDQVCDKIKQIQKTCEHHWERYQTKHDAGIRCVYCGCQRRRFLTRCLNPPSYGSTGPCKCDDMVITEEAWKSHIASYQRLYWCKRCFGEMFSLNTPECPHCGEKGQVEPKVS